MRDEIETRSAAMPVTHMAGLKELDDNPARRLSWRSIFAGALSAGVIYLALSFLGIGFGASAIDPLQEGNPFAGLGTSSIVWMIVSTVVAMFVGGYIAARVSGARTLSEGVLHGFLSWALMSLLMFTLLTSALGNVLGTTARTLGQGAGALGQAAGNVAPQAAEALRDNAPGERIIGNLSDELRNVVTSPEQAAALINQMDLAGVIRRFQAEGGQGLNPTDRSNLINLLVSQGGVGTEQATAAINRFEQALVDARTQALSLRDRAEGQARETGEVAARYASRTGFALFGAMLLGALSSSLGGRFGARALLRRLPTRLMTGSGSEARDDYPRAG